MSKLDLLWSAVPYRWGEARQAAARAVSAARYLTLKKALNFVSCEWDKQRRVARPRSFPYIAIVDPANLCPLHCPFCPTGAGRSSGRNKRLLDLELADRLLEEMGAYLISVNLFSWGEPLFHPALADLIRRFHDHGVFTSVSSNLNIRHRERLEQLVPAGLDYLIVSVSGATPETYQQYHRGGSLELVLGNIRHLIAHRRKAKRKRPLLEMKYLLFKYNRAEVDAARAMAFESGVDLFRIEEAGGPPDIIVDQRQAPRDGLESGVCHQLWQAVTINVDGSVPPCCYLFFKEDDFADYNRGNIVDILQGPLFVTARKLFDPRAVSQLLPNLKHPCLKCHVVHKQRHLQEYLQANPNAVLRHRTGGY